ncbi:MAG TPA: NAD-dependent epimerase/dehydratase family protein [Polyangiaceae bacterium]
MKVLVTGASGFLGSWVAELLSQQGHDVRVLVRKSSNRKHLHTLDRIEFAEGSVEDAKAVAEAVKGVDAIVHSAGLVKARNEEELRRTNVQGTQNLVDAAREHTPKLRRFVHVSSLEASGPSESGAPVSLEQERPATAYGRSKLAAEKVVLAAKGDLPVTVLRPGAIYGPRDAEILEAFKSISRGLMPTVGGGKALGVFVYGPDCAEACIRAIGAEVPSGSVYFVVDETGALTQKEFLEIVELGLGKRALVRLSLPVGLLRTVAHGVAMYGKASGKAVMLTPEKAAMLLQHFVCDAAPTYDALGWKPKVSLRDGVKQTVHWYRNNGWL